MLYKTYISVDERIAAWPGFHGALLKVQQVLNDVNIPVKIQLDDIEVISKDQFKTDSGSFSVLYNQWKAWSPLRKKLWTTQNGIAPPNGVRLLSLLYYDAIQQSNHSNGITEGRMYRFGSDYVETMQDIYPILIRRPAAFRKIDDPFNPSDREVLQFLMLILHELGHSFGASHDGWLDPKTYKISNTDKVTIMFGNIIVIDKDNLMYSKRSLKEMEGYMEFNNKGGSVYWRPEENWKPKIVSRNVDSGRYDDVKDFVVGRFSRATFSNGSEKTYRWVDSVTGKVINIRDKVQICLKVFGAVLPDDAQELFYQRHADVLKYLAPKIGWPMPLDNSNVLSQGFCEDEYGFLDTFDKVVRGTYNAGMSKTLVSKQGYQHTGNDIVGDPFFFFVKDKNLLINPFPDGMPVIAVRNTDGQEDRDGAPMDHGKSGNVYELHAFLDGDTKNLNPWNRMSITFVHCKKNSWRFDEDKVLITKFGVVIGRIGCSGYSGIRSTHSHVIFYLSNESFNPFYGPNSFFLVSAIFRDQEQLLQLIDFPYTERTRTYTNTKTGEQESVTVYPRDYKPSKGFHYALRFSVDDGDMACAHSIKPGLHKYVFESNVELSAILFDRNPWGEWKPIREPYKPSNWWKWIKEKYNQIILNNPTSRNLMDYSVTEPVFSEYITTLAYKDPDTSVLYEFPGDNLNPLTEKVHTCTIVVPSKVPEDDKAYGYYTFYGIYGKSTRTNRIVLKLEKEE